MALDLQTNWNVSMAENLDEVVKNHRSAGRSQDETPKTTANSTTTKSWDSPPAYLPDEIISQILDYISYSDMSQYTLASCCLLSRQWYSAAVSLLYASPVLYGNNYDPFVKVICPSINRQIKKSRLAPLVRILNLRNLVHQGSKAITARLLSRVKENLEAFVAPQATFGVNSFPALSNCKELRFLDLSLVSESPPLFELLKTVSRLQNLTTFRLPRSSGFSADANVSEVVWPPNLEKLSLSGGIDAHFMHGIVTFPITLRSLVIEHCAAAKGYALMHLLRTAVRPLPHLEQLKLANLPRLNSSSLDNLLFVLPGLTRLSVSVDYITPAVFDFDVSGRGHIFESLQGSSDVLPPVSRHQWSPEHPCKLRTLELTNSGNPGIEDKISPIDVLIAIDEGALPDLRQVLVAKSLFWQSNATASDVGALEDALKESAIQSGQSDGSDTGVRTFDG